MMANWKLHDRFPRLALALDRVEAAEPTTHAQTIRAVTARGSIVRKITPVIALAGLLILGSAAKLHAQADGVTFWNKMESYNATANALTSEVGSDLAISTPPGSGWSFNGAMFGDGWDNDTEATYAKANTTDLIASSREGALAFWWVPDENGDEVLGYYPPAGPHNKISMFFDNGATNYPANDRYGLGIRYGHHVDPPSFNAYFWKKSASGVLHQVSTHAYLPQRIHTGEWQAGDRVHIAFAWHSEPVILGEYIVALFIDGELAIGWTEPDAGTLEGWATTNPSQPFSEISRIGDSIFSYTADEQLRGPMDNLVFWDYAKEDYSDRFLESPFSEAEPLLWNKLGSALEVTNSESGPDGTIVGDISYLPGKFEDGFLPDARTGDPNIPDNYIRFDELNLGSQGTIEFWFQPSWVSGGHVRHLFYYGLPDQQYLLGMHFNDWQNKLNLGAYSASVPVSGISKYLVPSASPDWSTSQPFHIAVTWDGSAPFPPDRLRMYLNGNEYPLLNGVEDNPTFSEWGNPENALYLGTTGRSGDWNRHNWENAEGIIDNIKIWDFAKTDFSDRFDECAFDIDADGFCGDADNCPLTTNPAQSDIDVDGRGDLCDACPADATNSCDTDGSTAQEIAADEGGSVQTPDGELTLDVEPGDLGAATTISVTQLAPKDPEVDLMLGANSGLGQGLSVYDLEPDGQVFDAPVTLTIITDVSAVKPNFFDKLSLYLWTDTNGDDVEDAFVEIDGVICSVVNEPTDCNPDDDACISTATCTAEVYHFSLYALIAPLDSDGDAIPDRFGGVEDICPEGPNIIEGLLPPMTQLVPAGEAAGLPDKAFKNNRTLPMKLNYSCGSVPVTDQDAVTPPELLGLQRVGEAELLPTIDLDVGDADDTGAWFRYSGEHWIYNLSTKGFAVGTYEADVRMPDGRIFTGAFVLR